MTCYHSWHLQGTTILFSNNPVSSNQSRLNHSNCWNSSFLSLNNEPAYCNSFGRYCDCGMACSSNNLDIALGSLAILPIFLNNRAALNRYIMLPSFFECACAHVSHTCSYVLYITDILTTQLPHFKWYSLWPGFYNYLP